MRGANTSHNVNDHFVISSIFVGDISRKLTESSVTRFGKILTLWQILIIPYQYLEVYLVIAKILNFVQQIL